MFVISYTTLCNVKKNASRSISRLFETIIDFMTKMSYFTSQNVGNPVQIIKYVQLPRFLSFFVERLFTLKPFKAVYCWFLPIQICDKLRTLFIISNNWLCLNINYMLFDFVLKVINIFKVHIRFQKSRIYFIDSNYVMQDSYIIEKITVQMMYLSKFSLKRRHALQRFFFFK